MDKKHASCTNVHSKRNVKLLIEKFEGMGQCKVQRMGVPDWNIQSLSGRVAETVAKFEHNGLLGPRQARTLQLTCGDLSMEHWLADTDLNELDSMQPAEAAAPDMPPASEASTTSEASAALEASVAAEPSTASEASILPEALAASECTMVSEALAVSKSSIAPEPSLASETSMGPAVAGASEDYAAPTLHHPFGPTLSETMWHMMEQYEIRNKLEQRNKLIDAIDMEECSKCPLPGTETCSSGSGSGSSSSSIISIGIKGENKDVTTKPNPNGFDLSSPLMLCSLSRQVRRSIIMCGRPLVALGSKIAQAFNRFLTLSGRQYISRVALHPKAKAAI